MKWFYLSENNEVIGPVSESALGELKACGTIKNETRICHEGTEVWITFAEIPTYTTAPPDMPGTRKFSCPHCHQRVSAGSGDAGLSFLCPTCGGAIQVPSVAAIPTKETKPVKNGSSKVILFVAAGVAAVVIAGIIFMPSHTQKDQTGEAADDQLKSSHRETGDSADQLKSSHRENAQGPSGDIFQSRVSTKADVLGLRGGMSKEEAGKILGLKKLQAVPLTAINSATWIPGFQVFKFEPDESFPVKHVASIELVFLNDRLQSVCYNFTRTDCSVFLFKGGRTFIEDNRSSRFMNYERMSLISDMRAAIQGSFDITDQALYPDYSSGRSIPKGGFYSVEHEDNMKRSGSTYVDAVRPIFSAASSEIYVRFSGAVKNFDSIVSDLGYQLNRPNMVRAEGYTSEYFLLRFSFRNTYSESLAAGEAQLAKEANKAAEEAAKRNERVAAEKAAKDRAEEERIRKLKNGF